MTEKPWLDPEDYPFQSHYYEQPMGRMHYVDEGKGVPIVFVHGNPGWSFEFRKAIKALSGEYRCIAADNIGFGFSDKPWEWDYLPKNHAQNFARFIDHLTPDNFILVVNDWGGPIGLSYAINHPERIRHLVITNTWMWSVKNDWYYRAFSAFAGGFIGRFLIRRFNFFGKVILKQCIVQKQHFHPAVYQHLETARDRKGNWTFPKQIVASGDWLDSLWQQRQKLDPIPKTLLWGMGDIAFREKEFNTWNRELKNHKAIKLEKVGHFPHEEAAAEFIGVLRGM